VENKIAIAAKKKINGSSEKEVNFEWKRFVDWRRKLTEG